MACDPQSLINNSSCIACNIPNGMQLPVLIYLLCQIQQSGSSAQLFSHYSNSSTSGTGATDLYSDSIPANTLTTAGQRIIAEYVAHNTYGGTPYNVNITISFAGQVIWSNTLSAANPADHDLRVQIVMTGTTTARTTVVENLSYAAASPSQTVGITTTDLVGLNFAQANNLKITGTVGDGTQSLTAQQGYGEVLR